MIQINGAIQLIPGQVSTESGQLRVEEDVQPAVVQTLVTASGPVQVIYPSSAIPEVIKGLEQAKKEADTKGATTTDLYIPSSAQEVDRVAEAAQAIKDGADATRAEGQ